MEVILLTTNLIECCDLNLGHCRLVEHDFHRVQGVFPLGDLVGISSQHFVKVRKVKPSLRPLMRKELAEGANKLLFAVLSYSTSGLAQHLRGGRLVKS